MRWVVWFVVSEKITLSLSLTHTHTHTHIHTHTLQLPKATETTALSGAGFMRLVKNVGQSISKIASKKSETDSVRSLHHPV